MVPFNLNEAEWKKTAIQEKYRENIAICFQFYRIMIYESCVVLLIW